MWSRRVLKSSVCEMREVASVEEGHDVERVTETMRACDGGATDQYIGRVVDIPVVRGRW